MPHHFQNAWMPSPPFSWKCLTYFHNHAGPLTFSFCAATEKREVMFPKVERAGAPYNVSEALSIFVGRREFLLIPPYRIASIEGCQWTSFHQLPASDPSTTFLQDKTGLGHSKTLTFMPVPPFMAEHHMACCAGAAACGRRPRCTSRRSVQEQWHRCNR